MTNTDTLVHDDPPSNTAARLLHEGVNPLLHAAREAGLQPVPSHRTLLRAAIAGTLESLKVAGRRVTSTAAIVRWIQGQQEVQS